MSFGEEEHESVHSGEHSEENHGSLTGGRKSRRGGRKSRRGGSRKSRRGGSRKSRRGGRKSRRGGRKSRRAGRKSRRGGRKSRRGGVYHKKGKSCKGGRRKSCPKYCRRKTVRCQSYRRPKKVGRKHKKHRK
tara:strand:- start:1265 stop:1660 length:396 start_codon:yes stop_codon:yes gene_type:complete